MTKSSDPSSLEFDGEDVARVSTPHMIGDSDTAAWLKNQMPNGYYTTEEVNGSSRCMSIRNVVVVTLPTSVVVAITWML